MLLDKVKDEGARLRGELNGALRLIEELHLRHQQLAATLAGGGSEEVPTALLGAQSVEEVLVRELGIVERLSDSAAQLAARARRNLSGGGLQEHTAQLLNSRREHARLLLEAYQTQPGRGAEIFKELWRLFDAANLLCEELAEERAAKGRIVRRADYETNQSVVLATPRGGTPARELAEEQKMIEEKEDLEAAYLEKEKEL